jgi:UPF0755 protein
MKSFVVGALALIFAVTLWGFWEAFHFLSAGPEPAPGQEKIFEVMPGEGFYRIADRLATEGLVTDAFRFKILAKFSGKEGTLRIGEYAVRTGMRPMELLEVLASGKSIERQITFPEGYNIFEMAELIESKGLARRAEFLTLVRDGRLIQELLGEELPSLEGYLFPETYSYTKYTPLVSVVRGMVARFKEAYALTGHEATGGMTRHQLVTLASVIEKETGAPEERPLISSVFHNRLKKSIKLQSDPTIIYGIWMATGNYKNNITRADILSPTPYNTYTVPALPFGPIANPGRDALIAAFRPAESPFLYFVSKNDGTHTFSETLAAHNAAVKAFQMNAKAREGRSWRDLGNRKAVELEGPGTGTGTAIIPPQIKPGPGKGLKPASKKKPAGKKTANGAKPAAAKTKN